MLDGLKSLSTQNVEIKKNNNKIIKTSINITAIMESILSENVEIKGHIIKMTHVE